ncbi:MAG: polyprenyl diphosphate synthase [Acidimicrobiales bacterium]
MPLANLDPDRIPRHIGCVMDGNGRWAQARKLPRTEGHKAGEHSLFEVVDGCLDAGVEWLTVYAFSTENWRRPKDEVRFLINFNEEILLRRRDELNDRGVRIRFVGRRDWRVPKRLIRRMDEASELTRDNTKLTFTIAFNYGGRAEIVDAVRAIAASGVTAKKITERTIAEHLYDPDMPDPDLVIRTSGEYRISNFLLWQLAYSELIFTDTPWPEFGREQLFGAIAEYQDRERRFGVSAADVLYRDHAVVLRSWKLGEADRIVSLHTHDNGKVRAVAKGVRRTKSKFGARLEPLSHVAVQLSRSGRPRHDHPGRDGRPVRDPRDDSDRFARAESLLEQSTTSRRTGSPIVPCT